MGKWPAVVAVSAAMACIAAIGCGESLSAPIPAAHESDGPARHGGTLRLASFGDIRALDPAGPTDGLALQAEHLLFAGLVDYDASGVVAPDLAERWSMEDGGRTYRFLLREGVRMHDGAELTADDVVRSAERSLSPTTPNPNASYFANLAGFGAFASGAAEHLSGVTAEGRYVVVVSLEGARRDVPAGLGDADAAARVPDGGDPLRRLVDSVRRGALQAAGRRLAARDVAAPRASRRLLPARGCRIWTPSSGPSAYRSPRSAFASRTASSTCCAT